MQRPQVDLAVKRRLKRVWVSIRVFYAKYRKSENIRVANFHVINFRVKKISLKPSGNKNFLMPKFPTHVRGSIILRSLRL